MDALIDALKLKQMRDTDASFAARLGISRAAWNMIRLGKRKPGAKVLFGILTAFPDLESYCKNGFHQNGKNDIGMSCNGR